MGTMHFVILCIWVWHVFLCLAASSRAASLLIMAIDDRNLDLWWILTIFTRFHSHSIQIVFLSCGEDFLIDLFLMRIYVGWQLTLKQHCWGHQTLRTFSLTTFAGRTTHWNGRQALLKQCGLASSGLGHCWTWIAVLLWLGMIPRSSYSSLLVSRFNINAPIIWLLDVLPAFRRGC